MRRKPVAVYRVIDEHELLGGDAIAEVDGRSDLGTTRSLEARGSAVTREILGRSRRAPSARFPSASAVLAVVGLVCVAALLLAAPRHVRQQTRSTAVPEQRAIPPVQVTSSSALANSARPVARPAGYKPRRMARRLRVEETHTAASRTPSPRARPRAQAPEAVAPTHQSRAAAVGQEFGFER